MYSHHDEAIQEDSQQGYVLCAVASAFLAIEDDARAKVRLNGNSTTAARWADVANSTIRTRHQHVERCPQCLLVEALRGDQ
jgi:hypothetical protein